MTFADDKPNFIVIMTDDQGYQDLGCYGSPEIKTPRLDQMAKEGMRFTSFYAQTVCGPARAALMTGCYPMRVERANHDNGLVPHPAMSLDEITVAELLKPLGYKTGVSGKWDLSGRGSKKNYTFRPELNPSAQGFDMSFWSPWSESKTIYEAGELTVKETQRSQVTKIFTDKAIEFIQANKDEPFFLYLPHPMPHTPLDASEKFKGKSAGGLYGDVIEELDFHIGRVLDTVDELGLSENTYIIFTSDNGPWWIRGKDGGHCKPLRSGKTSTYDGGLRVPFIIKALGKVPAGSTCDLVCAGIDIMPTIVKLAGGSVPNDRVIDGIDISDIFQGKQTTLDRPFFFYQHQSLRAVRQGDWKLHLAHTKLDRTKEGKTWQRHVPKKDRPYIEEPTLYNLKDDIGETTNVAKEHPEIVEKLTKQLDYAKRDIGYHDTIGENSRRVSSHPKVSIKRSKLTGIGLEAGVCRRDPSDVIKVGDLYYVWYSKGPIKSGYNATVWYATSPDGIHWTEKGQAVGKGGDGTWDFGSVFTPGILVAENRYWLFFTGTSHPFQQGEPDSKIGLAVAESPDGPWEKLKNNPILRNSENKGDFDSLLIDDSCAMIRNGKIFLYYKGRQQGKTPHETKMGLAIAASPTGPYVKHASNPVIMGNHAILNWPQGKGVAAMIGVTGPKNLTNSIQYSEDGIKFTKTHNVVDGPRAAGSYRPDAFTGSKDAKPIVWGIEIGKHKKGELPYLERVELQWPGKVSSKEPQKAKQK